MARVAGNGRWSFTMRRAPSAAWRRAMSSGATEMNFLLPETRLAGRAPDFHAERDEEVGARDPGLRRARGLRSA
jgi:hypothetical protein